MPELLAVLDASMQEHRRCGELDGGVEGEVVWMTCECGAGLTGRARESSVGPMSIANRGRGGSPPDATTTRIPEARRKMQEAQFFFSRLGRKPPVDTLFTAGQVHRFHLSAFLSAAKSVFGVAQVELQGSTHFKTWLDTQSAEDRDFLLAVHGQRDLETHGRGIQVEEQPYHFEP